MALPADIEPTRLSVLEPINRLEGADQSALLDSSEILDLPAGEMLYAEGDIDDHANYLLEGTVQILWNGKQVKLIDARDKAALQALDSSGRKRFSVRANSAAKVLRVSRSQLEEKLRRIDVSEKLSGLNIGDTAANKWPAWKLRVLRSQMFRPLPMSQIQEITRHLERIAVTQGEVIVQQGDDGDAYYIIDEGSCAVHRHPPHGGEDVHVADLGQGDAFGEEALITSQPRNATVTMSADGHLLRMPADAFQRLVYRPMVRSIDWTEAQDLLAENATWLDVRPPNKFVGGSLRGAINLPLTLLRLDHQRLEENQKYLVAADDTARAAVATLLLTQRGIDALSLAEPIDKHLEPRPPQPVMLTSTPPVVSATTEDPPMNQQNVPDPVAEAQAKEAALSDLDSKEPIPRDLYDDTYVGKSLADLIDQMHDKHHELLEDTGSHTVADLELAAFQNQVEADLPAVEVDPLPAPTDPPLNSPREGDEITQFMHTLERMLRETVEKRVSEERRTVQAHYSEKVARVKRSAVQEVKRQTQLYRDKIHAEHAHRTKRLKDQYQKLMALAHRVSRQKAELKRARQEMESKLQATTRLQREIDTLRETLSQSLGNFDTLDDDSELAGSDTVNAIGLEDANE